MTKFKKGDHVAYRPWSARENERVTAIVRCAHRDGTVTVEARFWEEDGVERPYGYLGYVYRFAASSLEARR